jgi:hypothetical protein
MNQTKRRAKFEFSLEMEVWQEALTGKWSARYRFTPDPHGIIWMACGSQHGSRAEAIDAVLIAAKSLYPEIPQQWLSEAKVSLGE